ncbi:MAG: DUF1570 domain-containing protein [Candidatus Omnitrophota bacterium]
MKISRSLFLFIILLGLLSYVMVFSIRSPLKDVLYPVIYKNMADQIDTRVGEIENAYVFHLKDGKKLKVSRFKKTGDDYFIRGSFGHSGFIEESIHADTIERIEPVTIKHTPVSANEIVAKRLFPDFHVFRRDTYTFFSDESYFYIENTIDLLETLRGQIKEQFPEIFDDKADQKRIGVVIFRSEKAFKEFAKKFDPALTDAAGFYNDDYQTFFIYNLLSHQLDQKGLRLNVSNAMSQSNDAVRHEGAHQIFYSADLHYGFGLDRLWLVEGLAVYSEPYKVGARIYQREKDFRQAVSSGRFIALEKLIQEKGMFSSKSVDDMRDFYNESWALVYYLMDKQRLGFSKFLMRTKARPFDSFLKGDDKVLEETLGMNVKTLEKKFKAYWGFK